MLTAAQEYKIREMAEWYQCSCHEAFSSRDLHDPQCEAYQFGDDLRAILELTPLCIATHKVGTP